MLAVEHIVVGGDLDGLAVELPLALDDLPGDSVHMLLIERPIVLIGLQQFGRDLRRHDGDLRDFPIISSKHRRTPSAS